jgi:Protein of unknown function (DUF1573)
MFSDCTSPSRRMATRVIVLWLAIPLCSCLPQGTDLQAVDPGRSDHSMLTASPPLLDFGEVARGSRTERTFSISNPGQTSATIGNVEVSCDCLNIRIGGSTVRPGQSVQATALLDLSKEPEMTSSLRIEVKAHEKGTTRLAFSVLVDVNVKEIGKHSDPGPSQFFAR